MCLFLVTILAGCAKLFTAKTLTMLTDEVWHLLILSDSSLWNAVDIYPPIIASDMGVQVEVFYYAYSSILVNQN